MAQQEGQICPGQKFCFRYLKHFLSSLIPVADYNLSERVSAVAMSATWEENVQSLSGLENQLPQMISLSQRLPWEPDSWASLTLSNTNVWLFWRTCLTLWRLWFTYLQPSYWSRKTEVPFFLLQCNVCVPYIVWHHCNAMYVVFELIFLRIFPLRFY